MEDEIEMLTHVDQINKGIEDQKQKLFDTVIKQTWGPEFAIAGDANGKPLPRNPIDFTPSNDLRRPEEEEILNKVDEKEREVQTSHSLKIDFNSPDAPEQGLKSLTPGVGLNFEADFDATLRLDGMTSINTVPSPGGNRTEIRFEGRPDGLERHLVVDENGSTQKLRQYKHGSLADGMQSEVITEGKEPFENTTRTRFYDSDLNPEHKVREKTRYFSPVHTETETSFQNHPAKLVSQTVVKDSGGERTTQRLEDGTEIVTIKTPDGTIVKY